MKKNTKWLLVAFTVFILLIVGVFYYNDWHSKEYPSGDLVQSTNMINIFYGGWYCNHIFISFDDVFQVGETGIKNDFDMNEVKENIFFVLDYCNLEYNVSYVEWCDDKQEVVITLNESVEFVVSYHTYDRQRAGTEAWSTKEKVFEGVYIKP